MDKLNFTTMDYLIFALMMVLSTGIGIYYGFLAKRKQDNTAEYLLGSKKIGMIPISASIIATRISATIIIGVPAEIYKFGSQYYIAALSGLVAAVYVSFVYLPVLHELQAISCYTYLERRFDKRISKFASMLFFIYVIILSPLLIYTPALAFSQVSGINLHFITVIICCVCIFYTTVGGLRAVVWTDTIQFVAMIGALITVMILGTIKVGGLTNVFKLANDGGRLVLLNMDPNPFARNTFWMMTFGLGTLWAFNIGVSQECVQRYLSIPKLENARKVVFITALGNILMKLSSVFIGLLIYSKYAHCDPLFNGEIQKYDQIVPYYVMDVTRQIPGLSGLFIVGVLSAALSTISSSLNSLAGTAYNDFIKPFTPNATEQQASKVMKLLVVGIGVLCYLLIFVVERLGGIFGIGVAFSGITCGTILGLFTVGMLSTKFNSKGALWGSISSVFIVGFIAVGAQYYIYQKQFKYETLPFNVSQCTTTERFPNFNVNDPFIFDNDADPTKIPWIFKINFTYYTLIGVLVLTLVGYPVSCITGGAKNLDEKLLAPFLRKRIYGNCEPNSNDEVEMSLKKNTKS